MIQKLVDEIKRKKNPCIVGLDPQWEQIPKCYKEANKDKCEVIWNWSRDVIDAVSDIVAVVKPQIAFYEQYGSKGIEVFEKVINYAHASGLIVIDDCKRGDIESTAKAYAFAHLDREGTINADFITVNPFLGMDSIEPFIRVAEKNKKGIFVLVRTSNEGAKDYQDGIAKSKYTISEEIAYNLNAVSEKLSMFNGYTSLGAVVGATYPNEARKLRKIMKHSYILVPGYGAQGGDIETCLDCFNEDGLGALISSSRHILYSYLKSEFFDGTRKSYIIDVQNNCKVMRDEVYLALKNKFECMEY